MQLIKRQIKLILTQKIIISSFNEKSDMEQVQRSSFLAVQDSSITDIVGSLVGLGQLKIRAYGASKSDPRHY